MNFNVLAKPPTKEDEKGWYRWFYRVCEILNGGVSIVNPKGTYADNATALAGGLVVGDIYKTATGVLMVVY
jgi:hypothetical protein